MSHSNDNSSDNSPAHASGSDTDQKTGSKSIGRNEPCPCRSGKKYKRCCGVDAAPVLNTPKDPGQVPGVDPKEALAGMSPEMLKQMTAALQGLSPGKLIKLQRLMSKAMKGKDISAEAEAFEKELPPGLLAMMQQMPGASEDQSASPSSGETKKLTDSELSNLVDEVKQDSKFTGFWKKLVKKKG